MAKLYFRYGVMGSSKSANALMVKYNYEERGQKAVLVKPRIDKRDGNTIVKSRCGLQSECEYFDFLSDENVRDYNCVIVDEAQFLSKREVEFLVKVVDEYNVPVIAYGLRSDFAGNLFEGSTWLLAWADTIEEVKTVCWCGRKATCNTRIENGRVTKVGEQIVLGANDKYIALCRRHWAQGNLGPDNGGF